MNLRLKARRAWLGIFMSSALLPPALILPAGAQPISPSALAEIQALEQEKTARTPAQQKMDSNLIYAHRKLLTGMASRSATHMQPDVRFQPDGRVLVDITATVSESLLAYIRQSGGQVASSFPQYDAIRALVPLPVIEAIAGRPEVRFISRAHEGRTNASSTDPEGDICHEANLARSTFGADGTGIKVGVMSGGDDSNALAVAIGDLPNNVTTLPGQSGAPSDGEGTAMLEIIYRLAPGAQLYYATGLSPATYNPTNLGPSESQMASNILALAAAGCNIIVDDISYPDESPFQEAQPIVRAVQSVSDQGVFYFSCARNSGNQDSSASGTWEGDFADGGAAGPPISGTEAGRLHNFGGGTNYNTVTISNAPSGDLFWSDPLGASTNDYDLFVLDPSGTSVLVSSTTTQNGSQDPYEHVGTLGVGWRIVIVKRSGTARFLHLDTGRCQIAITTAGCIRGHNCSSATNAFCVAATPVSIAHGPGEPTGPYPNPFTGGAANFVEFFSSDGPRRLFYYPNGTPITPGNFSSTGGALLAKPDFTAADGVTTTVFPTFFGTSCAAPHAAAIAALLLSYNPSLTPDQVRSVLTNTALPVTVDSARTAGAGIVMAYQALAAASANNWTNTANGKWEVGNNWSLNQPPDRFHTTVISNAPSKTVTLDATTSGSFPASLTMLSLTVSAPAGSTNTLLLNNAGLGAPLTLINGAAQSLTTGRLILETNGAVAVNHSAILLSSNLNAGKFGGNTFLNLTNGGALTNVVGFVGINTTSSNNAVLVSGAGSLWNNLSDLELGENGSGNAVTIANGGVVYDNFGILGLNASSGGNSVLVSGAGSLWSNRTEVNVGASGSGNSLLVSNGGTVVDSIGLLGLNGSSSNNTVLVTGSGSAWNNSGDLFVGQNGTGNLLTISNNGLVFARDVIVGVAATNPANRVSITGGSLYVTNPLGNSVLDIRNGTLTLNSGTVVANQLLLTNGASAVFTFNGGLLGSGTATVNNGQVFPVGNGSNTATFSLLGGAVPNLLGGVYSFANSLQITSNAFLTGCGIINGNVTIDPGGAVHADCGDTLNFFGAVTVNGTVSALNGTFINFYGPVVNNGVLNATGGFVRFFSTFQNNGTALTNSMVAMPVLTTLHNFTGGADGGTPTAAVVQGTDGNFYGTTYNGGASGLGAVFRITPAGVFTNLYSFTGTNGDGANPYAGLVQATNGFFYGTTPLGGVNGGFFGDIPLGTIFAINPASGGYGKVDFNGANGGEPYAGLVEGSDGNLYGTTSIGGATYLPGAGQNGAGAIIKVTLAGNITVAYSFNGPPTDGLNPDAGLLQDSNGNFYGTTISGGIANGCLNTCGTLFRLNTNGTLTTLDSGGNPRSGFVRGNDGLFYGTTTSGGAGQGSVFRIDLAGTPARLHSFTNFIGEGAVCYAGLVQGSDGNFYGTTFQGGIANTGTVFRITPAGALTTLYGFTGGSDGAAPYAGLVQGIDGNFYGTTASGGASGWGTVFKLSVYLVPPTNQLSQITGIQIVGTSVLVSLTSVAGKAYQLQYRTALGTGGWSNVPGAATNGFGGLLTLADAVGALQAQRFYRVVITP